MTRTAKAATGTIRKAPEVEYHPRARRDDRRTAYGEMTGLTERLTALEPELRAAIVAAPDPNEVTLQAGDSEGVELRALMDKANIAGYLSAAAKGTHVDGAQAELNKHLETPDGFVPMPVLVSGVELRAKTGDVNSQVNAQSWVDRLFFDTALSHLGITLASVPAGMSSVPITTAGAMPAQRGREQAQGAEAWTVAASEIRPSRMTTHIIYSREDELRLPGLAAALQRDMTAALTEKIDRTVFLGDATPNEDSADIAAITATTGITAQTLSQANKVKATETLAEFVSLIDGKHASSTADLRVVAALGWSTLMASTMANSAVSNQTLQAFLNDNGVTFRARGGLAAGTGSSALFAVIGLQRGMAGAVQGAIWDSAELVRDPYSGASKGTVSLTLSSYWNYQVVRATNLATLSAS